MNWKPLIAQIFLFIGGWNLGNLVTHGILPQYILVATTSLIVGTLLVIKSK